MNNNLLDRATPTGAALGLFAFPAWWPSLEATASWAAYMVPIISVLLLSVQLARWLYLFLEWLKRVLA